MEKLDEAYANTVEIYISANSSNKPRTYRKAVNGPQEVEWKDAMADEFNSLQERGTWEVVPRPTDRRIVSCKWVYRVKYDADGNITHYKARLVARGFSQVFGIDYTETYAPVTRLETIRLLFALAVENDWEVCQIDVKTAYLYGELDEEIFMEPPEGQDIPKGNVLLLRKAIYSLKQASRQWYRKLHDTMAKFDLKLVKNEPHTFVAHKVVNGVNRTLIIPIYVDDLFPIGDNVLTDEFEAWIGNYFEITPPCDTHYFLGIRVKRDRNPPRDEPYISIDQVNYAQSIISRLNEVPEIKDIASLGEARHEHRQKT